MDVNGDELFSVEFYNLKFTQKDGAVVGEKGERLCCESLTRV